MLEDKIRFKVNLFFAGCLNDVINCFLISKKFFNFEFNNSNV